MSYINSPIAKRFGGGVFRGRITDHFQEDELWHVKYDDGDEEDMDRSEIVAAIELHKRTSSTARKRKQKTARLLPEGQKIRKYFRGHGTFAGKISKQPTEEYPYYFVTYRDGDSEHIHMKDIDKYVDRGSTPCKLIVQDVEENKSVPMACIMCQGHSRKSNSLLDTAEQLLPVRLKPQGRGAQKIVVAYIHACCALRAPPSPQVTDSKETSDWWEEVVEKTHGHEGLPNDRFDSTSATFVPYAMTFSDWVDEFALYNYRILLASVRRFDECRGPPHNFVQSTAAVWRCDDRGSIGYCRMITSLVARARDEIQLSSAEGALWGAILYRVFNRLSTFSRWAAVKALAAKLNTPISTVLKRSNGTSIYELACHGPPKDRKEEFHAIAASGVTLYGRHGYRDRWGKDFCMEQMSDKRPPMCCVADLPLPTELSDFKAFIEWEVSQQRGVSTAEHQVQSKSKIFAMLQKLAAKDCAKLKELSSIAENSSGAQPVLDSLRTLDTIGDFFAWQIFSDLVNIQHHCQLFGKGEILPSSVIEDSLFSFALFGPGARKGAYIVDGGAPAILEFDRDVSQATTLIRARRILEEFSVALKRTKLDKKWEDRAHGRPYDLETMEHSLCGFYGVMCNLVEKVIELDDMASLMLEKIAHKNNYIWPPGKISGSSHSASTREQQGGQSWRPNPGTTMERTELRNMVKAAKSNVDGNSNLTSF